MSDLIPPNTSCYLEIPEPQAAVLFSLVTRATGMPGSKQTHRSRILNALKVQLEEFETARLALVKEHAAKDEAGEAKLDPATNQFDIPDMKAFTEAYKTLRKEQPIIVDGRSDELKHRALCAIYEMLNSDACPSLMGPQQGRPFDESETLLFAPLLDAFKFEPRASK